MPTPFKPYMKHLRTLNFGEKPDYDYLRKLFLDYLELIGKKHEDLEMDWVSSNEEKCLDDSIKLMEKVLEDLKVS